MEKEKLEIWIREMKDHLSRELLPFWVDRVWDAENGGFITQFDGEGRDTGLDEKSLLAHMRTIYSLSLAYQKGNGGEACRRLAEKGVDYALEKYWDPVYGGFYWLFNRKGSPVIDQKIIYGHSFAIYALATYTTATGDPRGLAWAEKCFDLLQKYAAETSCGGYWEMFHRDWRLCGPGAAGGDRKTLDVHMHLMEAFTALYECSGKDIHRRKLQEIIQILLEKILHPVYRTGIPQFYRNWEIAPQIKFDIIWGWDRFDGESQEKPNSLDNTSYGHNVEFFWLLLEALRVLGEDVTPYLPLFTTILNHSVEHGVDWEYGGVYVEGSLDGSRVHDYAKEFWQQAEFLSGMPDAYRLFRDERYLKVYGNVHDFVMKKMIKHEVGEWLPLLAREGEPIWTHMSHSWKVNYHTIRAAVLSVVKLESLLAEMK